MTESEAFLQSALDALSAHVAILDRDGTIVAVNAAWQRFAAANGCAERDCGVGSSYLAAYRASGLSEAGAAAEGIDAVARGALPRFVMDSASDGPDGRRWFQMTVTRFAATEPVRLVVAHEDVTARRQTEDELRRSEERYRAFLSQSSEAIWRFELAVPMPVTLDLDAQVEHVYAHAYLAECNDATAQMYGWERAEDLIGARLDVLLPREVAANVAYLRRFTESGYRLSGGESVERDRSGAQRVFLNNLIGVVEDGELLRAWGTQREVTAMRAAESALLESERKLRLALEAGGLAIWEWNSDGTRVVSDNYAGVVGAAPLTNETFLDLVHEADRGGLIASLQRALRETGVYHHEYRVVLPDGSVRWIAGHGRVLPSEQDAPADGTPVRMIGFVMDVTARREVEEQREDARRSMQLALSVARAGVWSWELERNRVTGDESMARLFGLPPEDVVAGRLSLKPFLAAVHPDDRRRVRQDLASILGAGGEYHTEYRVEGEGGLRWVSSRGKVQTGADGAVQRVAGIVFDVTAERRHERERALLGEIGEVIRIERKPAALLDAAARLLRERLELEACLLAASDEQGKWTVRDGERQASGRIASLDELPLLAGDTRQSALRAGRTVFARDAASSIIAVPRLRDGEPALVCVAVSDAGHSWDESAAALLDTIVERVWTALERLRLDARLRASERRYRSLVSATASIVAVTDGSGWFVTPQPAWEAYTGQTWEEHRDYGYIEAVHPDDRAAAAAAWERARLAQAPMVYEARLRQAASGSYRMCVARVIPVFDAAGTLCEWVASVTDIDEQRRKELQLRASEAEWRLVFESAREFGIFTLDLDRHVTRWNPGASRLMGYADDEILGRLGDVIFTAADRAAGAPERESELALRSGRAEDERWHVRKDGSRFWASGLMMPLKNERNESIGLVKILRDMTAAKQAAEEREKLLRDAEAAREEAERANAAKDSFLATLSHELRSPLQAAMGWVTLMRSGRLSAEQQSKAVETLDRSIRHQVELVNDLLDVSRTLSNKLHLELAAVDLALIVEQVGDECRAAANQSGIELITDVDVNGVTVLGDAQRLGQVVRNLLTNAIKFTPAGGRVTVSCVRQERWVQLAVEDTGKGISSDFLPLLFDRFSQADPSITRRHGGLGLGLAIVRHLVELHGGAVEAESAGEGRGATFRVRLPVAPTERWRPSVVRPRAVDPAELDGLVVMLVDDDEPAQQVIQTLLEQAGANVLAASSAREAYEVVASRRPDVIVSDLAMPDEDGFWLARALREAGVTTPLIAVSGLADLETRTRALRAGFTAHLAKPTDPRLLVETIRRTVSG